MEFAGSDHTCGEDTQVIKIFTCLGSMMLTMMDLPWPGPWCYKPPQHEFLAFLTSMQVGEDLNLLLVLPGLLYDCETWTLNINLEKHLVTHKLMAGAS